MIKRKDFLGGKMKEAMGVYFPSIKHAHHHNVLLLRALWRSKRSSAGRGYTIIRKPFVIMVDPSVDIDLIRNYKDVLQFPLFGPEDNKSI